MKISFILIIIATLTACDSANKKNDREPSKDSSHFVKRDTVVYPKTGELYNWTPEEIKSFREQEIADSIISEKTLNVALRIANKTKHKGQFAIYSDTLDITYGNLLSSRVKHLVIKRKFPWGISTNVYRLKKNKFLAEFSKELALNIYVDDTVKDINGDGNLDYLFHWYPAAGCCLRDIYDVFLQDSLGDFTKEMEFLNPTFFPKEHIIRGLCYGYGAPLYKIKWHGFSIDTVEYMYFPDSTNGNQFVRRKHENREEKGQRLKKLPPEYEGIGN